MNDRFEDAKKDHKITDRESQAWKANKQRKQVTRPVLTIKQQNTFLKLVAELASPILFERELGLSMNDVAFFKKEFDIETQEDARQALRRFKLETEEQLQARISNNIQTQREAEAIAQQRLDQFELKRMEDAAAKRAEAVANIDINGIKKEDAARQKRLIEQQNSTTAKMATINDWRLQLDGRPAFDKEIIATFHHDILERGFKFCMQKYGTSSREIQLEASRLGLVINWDDIRY